MKQICNWKIGGRELQNKLEIKSKYVVNSWNKCVIGKRKERGSWQMQNKFEI